MFVIALANLKEETEDTGTTIIAYDRIQNTRSNTGIIHYINPPAA